MRARQQRLHSIIMRYILVQLYLGDAYRHLGDMDKAKHRLEDSVTHFKQQFRNIMLMAIAWFSALYVDLHQLS